MKTKIISIYFEFKLWAIAIARTLSAWKENEQEFKLEKKFEKFIRYIYSIYIYFYLIAKIDEILSHTYYLWNQQISIYNYEPIISLVIEKYCH
jgi:hypothetical protein